MIRFEKVSKERYDEDAKSVSSNMINGGMLGGMADYELISLPRRATKSSAGYDIFSPMTFILQPGETIKFPTGLRIILDDDKFLLIAPRSGLGFKYRLQLDNTVGIIDADYANSDNEGHIWIKITNDSRDGKSIFVNQGVAIAQGIILRYFLTDDDQTTETRNGGLGSTDKKA